MNFSAITANTTAQVKQAASLSVLKMANNNAAAGATAMIQNMTQSQAQHPHLGGKLDIKA